MVVELISVGTEILLGNIVNTNAAYLSEKCAQLGFCCYYQTVVGDNEERLAETVKVALSRSDIVILGGGLGPTQDDLTKEVTCKVLGIELVEDEAAKKNIEVFFEKKGVEAPNINSKQALVPKGSIVLQNNNGTAPGCIIEQGEKRVIMLPGPPGEMKPMFEEGVVPYLSSIIPGVIISKSVKICGIGESEVAKQLEDMISSQDNPTIATYAKTCEVLVRVTAKAKDEQTAKKMLKPVVKEIKTRFGTDIYSTDEGITLEKSVVELLCANDLHIATVESCTGGLLAGRLINVPGVSENFKTGLITYSNKSKRKLVNVKKTTLEKYGAVSKQTAEEMVEGMHLLSKADVVVSTTGIAGPDGGSEEKPVGTVFISVFVCGKITTQECHFTGNRANVREATVATALTMLRRCILEYYSQETFGKD